MSRKSKSEGKADGASVATLPAERKAGDEVAQAASRKKRLPLLCLTALGIVYGDIGTSPLYALRECFHASGESTHLAVNPLNVLGVLSLITWSLVIVISITYLLYVMRADNRGEGGILALLALLGRKGGPGWFVLLSVFGAALLYGDGMITPAISVLSAVEGLKIAAPISTPWIVGASAAILVLLFYFQKHGTRRVGLVFGPIMMLWFATIACLGVSSIMQQPEVLAALNPLHAVQFFAHNGWLGFTVLGAVFLVVTGGEALYADLGHFGGVPIRVAWFGLVLPALLLNYFGQGAHILRTQNVEHPFFSLAPKWALYPLVALATAAAIIASQAIISGVFSLTRQAVLLNRFPRVEIDQTSDEELGQVYIPALNWILMLACLGLVFGFGSSSNLAGAYGVAVATTMVITTLLLAKIARSLWHWNLALVVCVTAAFLVLDLGFFGANLLKFFRGGWFPILMGLLVFLVMSTWHRGHELVTRQLRKMEKPLGSFLGNLTQHPPVRVPGTSVFLTGQSKEVPAVLLHHLRHNKALSDDVLLLDIEIDAVPHVPPNERIECSSFAQGFRRVRVQFGFMDIPDVPRALKSLELDGRPLDLNEVTYYVGRPSPVSTSNISGMARWREKLFIFLNRNSTADVTFLKLPAKQIVELGMELEI
ncbi:MAG: potassium transporter Kup [Chthoniobacterales bacterium]